MVEIILFHFWAHYGFKTKRHKTCKYFSRISSLCCWVAGATYPVRSRTTSLPARTHRPNQAGGRLSLSLTSQTWTDIGRNSHSDSRVQSNISSSDARTGQSLDSISILYRSWQMQQAVQSINSKLCDKFDNSTFYRPFPQHLDIGLSKYCPSCWLVENKKPSYR